MNSQLHLLLQEAIQAFQRGNLDSAASLLIKLLRIDSKNLPALNILGLIKASQTNYKEAVDYLTKAAQIQPNDASIQYNLAKALMDSGDDSRATKHHKKAVELNPQNPQAWLNYGRTAFNLGMHHDALSFLDKALNLDSNYYFALINKARVLEALNRPIDALNICNIVLKLYPESYEAHNALGLILNTLKRYDDALIHYENALNIKPDYYEALNNKGIALHTLKKFDQSMECYDKALTLNPKNYEAWGNKGLCLYSQKRYSESLDYYNQALKINNNSQAIWLNKGLTYYSLKDFNQAISCFDKALELNHNYYEAWTNKGLSLFSLLKLDEAIVCHEKSLNLNPTYVQAWNNLAIALHQVKKYDESQRCIEKAIELEPGNAESLNNKGLILHAVNHFEEALVLYDEALQINPDYYEAWSNRGVTLHALNRIDEAILCYDHSLRINPNYHEAIFNKGISLLLQGDLINGFLLYNSRWDSESLQSIIGGVRSFDQPKWDGGKNINGKTIYLYGEQGFGDCIQFFRYAELVGNLGANVILEVPKPLLSIASKLTGIAQVICKGENPPYFDFHFPLMSLPVIFKTDINTIPSSQKYINIHSYIDKLEKWQRILNIKSRPRIGLAWSGNPNHKNDQNRSISLEYLINFLPNSFEYISLQNEILAKDAATLKESKMILDVSTYLTDFSETAALIDSLDLVVTVDTSLAHLSGAMGKKTWLLLPFVPDWRWLLTRDDSPWYASIKIYRQKKLGDWNGLLQELCTDLNNL